MVFEVRLPRFGEGTEDATLIEWLVQEGESFEAGSRLASFETAKAVVEVEAEQSGVLRRALVNPGTDVPVGGLLAICSTTASEPLERQAPSKSSVAEVQGSEPARPMPGAPVIQEERSREPLSQPGIASRIFASPAARKLARTHGIDLATVKGTGATGRIRAADVAAAIAAGAGGSASDAAVDNTPMVSDPVTARSGSGSGPPMTLPATPMRGPVDGHIRLPEVPVAAARTMSEARLAVPMVTVFDQANISELHQGQERHNSGAGKRHISLTAIVVRTVAIGIRHFPELNAETDAVSRDVVNRHPVDVGVLLDAHSGSVVPIVSDAGTKSIAEIARELEDVAQRIASGTYAPENLRKPSIVVEDLGATGTRGFTPVVMAPSVAALGIARARVEPSWNSTSETFEPRLQLPLSLTVDHRAADRAQAARFLRWVCEALAEPFLWLL